MLKSYEEMRKIPVKDFCEVKKEGSEEIYYLNWARCFALLRENGAERVWFEPIINPATGTPLFYTDTEWKDKNGVINRNYWTSVRVIVDDKEYTMTSPVMNGMNPVKDNSMSQQRVYNSLIRSVVKCIAINTGLGFDLWLKGEEAESREQSKQKEIIDDNIALIKRRVGEKLSAINVSGLSLDEIAKKMDYDTGADLQYDYKSIFKAVETFENKVDAVLKEIEKDDSKR